MLPGAEQVLLAADVMVGQALVAEQFRVQQADPDAPAGLRVVVGDVGGLREVLAGGGGCPLAPAAICGYPLTRDGR